MEDIYYYPDLIEKVNGLLELQKSGKLNYRWATEAIKMILLEAHKELDKVSTEMETHKAKKNEIMTIIHKIRNLIDKE